MISSCLQTGQTIPVPKIENQKMDNSVHSLISVKATSELIANCSATNELGTDVASQSIKAGKCLFSDCRNFST